jgi:hypothetical protein
MVRDEKHGLLANGFRPCRVSRHRGDETASRDARTFFPERITTMFAPSTALSRRSILAASTAAAIPNLVLFAAVVWGDSPKPASAIPSAREILGPVAVVPLTEQPPAKIVIDPPLPDPLAKGLVVIQFRTENLRLMPVFGPAALDVSPRIGHVHVTLDDAPWVWANTSGEELIINGLPPGPHKIRMELVNANHKPLAEGVVKFEVPRPSRTEPASKAAGNTSDRNAPVAEQAPAKMIVDPPQPDRLARGVVFIEYRTENVKVLPVFGPAALAVSPRVGHIHVTVDEAHWHWADASGGPVIVADLSPGPHKILIELVNANHKPLAQSVVKFDVPRRSLEGGPAQAKP